MRTFIILFLIFLYRKHFGVMLGPDMDNLTGSIFTGWTISLAMVTAAVQDVLEIVRRWGRK